MEDLVNFPVSAYKTSSIKFPRQKNFFIVFWIYINLKTYGFYMDWSKVEAPMSFTWCDMNDFMMQISNNYVFLHVCYCIEMIYLYIDEI